MAILEYVKYIPFELGFLEIKTDEDAVISLAFCDKIEVQNSDGTSNSIMKEAVSQVKSYLSGKCNGFDLPLKPMGTEFQKKVWAELVKIPYGKTISYLDLANALGDSKVIRAAASANGKNPIPLIIPCHRVIGKSGRLVGFSGGLHIKSWLLQHENRYANGVLSLF